MTLVSVIIPVYNEEQTVGELLQKVAAVALEKEVIVVDDGSTDRTREILRANAAALRHVHSSAANAGKGAAIRIGLSYASGEIVLIQDADLELDPAEYQRLIAPILEGQTNVVYGTRFHGGNRIPPLTRFANEALTTLTNVLYGASLTDMETAYKVFRTSAIRRIRLTARRFEIEPEITAKLLRAGERIDELPIGYRPRTKYEGKKIQWRDGLVAVWTLLRYRFAPRGLLFEEQPDRRLSAGGPAPVSRCPVCDGDLGSAIALRGESRLLPCARCGLQVWRPTSNPGGTWYDTSDHYLAMPIVDWLGWYHSVGIARVPSEARTLLDIGCADGRFVHAAARRGIDAVGIDHAARLVAAGNARYGGKRLSVGTAEELGRAGRQYDVVTMFEVIEHVEQPMTLLETAFGLVRPGGTLIVSTPNRLGKPRVPEHLDSPPHHLSRWTPVALERALRRAGFDQVEITMSPAAVGLKAFILQRTQLGVAMRVLRRGASAGGAAPVRTRHVRNAIRAKDVAAGLLAYVLAPLVAPFFRDGQMVAAARRPDSG